jgi:hypothetical protein
MKLLLEVPLNRLSFGNVSYNIIRELHSRDVDLAIFPINPVDQIDLSAFDPPKEIKEYIDQAVKKRWQFLKENVPCFKLWHLNGSDNRKTRDQFLFSFYECNKPTEEEISICAAQNKTLFSSSHAVECFQSQGCENVKFVPLGFDKDFFRTEKTYLKDVVHFGLMGKFENRKHTQKIIRTWLKKYGNNNKYQLSCCVNNMFFQPEQMRGIINETLGGQHYNNINFLPSLDKNSEVNELLNSIDIDLTGLSGGEGWNLPAFNSTCLGKWSIVLNCTSHKDWATENNSILIEPSGEMPVEDGVFFSPSNPFNKGTFHTWEEEQVVAAMEKAESKAGQINSEGQNLAEEMTYSNTLNSILDFIKV